MEIVDTGTTTGVPPRGLDIRQWVPNRIADRADRWQRGSGLTKEATTDRARRTGS